MDAARLVAQYEPEMRRFFRGRADTREDAEDLYQEAVLAIVSGYPRFAGRSSVSTWVYAICRNIHSHYAAGRMRRRKLDQALGTDASRAPAGTPVRHDLRLALDRLPPPQRELYRLHYEQGFPIREIAARLERPQGTVKYQLYMLRSALRRLLT